MNITSENGPTVSVVVCAHNEEKYVGKCLKSVKRALKNIKSEIIFVADRCTDNTAKIAKMFDVTNIIEKNWKNWKNSYAEALQAGYLKAVGKYLSIIDADIVIPKNFFDKMIPMLDDNKVASVSAQVVTYPYTFLNRLVYAWEQTYEFTPFGRKPRGAARVILKHAIDEVGGFNDVPAPDTDIDLRLKKRGYKSIYSKAVKVWHIRNITLNKIVKGQIGAGKARYTLGVSFIRTVSHAVFRVRPFLICGWLLEYKIGRKHKNVR